MRARCAVAIIVALSGIVVGIEGVSYASDRSRAGCIVDQAAIADVQKLREELSDARIKLQTREAEVLAREQAVNEELAKLSQARKDLLVIKEQQSKVDEEKLAKFVETILAMSPKVASRLLSNVEESLAVAAIYQMDTKRLGKILNVMETGTSSRLSELMVGIVQGKGGKDDSKHERMGQESSAISKSKPVEQVSSGEGPSGRVASDAVTGGQDSLPGVQANEEQSGVAAAAKPGNRSSQKAG